MNRHEDFEDLNEMFFKFYNSEENRSLLTGQPKHLNVYEIQYLIYYHLGEKEGIHKNAITRKLSKWLIKN